MPVAHGTFEVSFTPRDDDLDGRVSRAEFTKSFAGDLTGTGRGVMLSGGSPAAGSAGYIAIETVDGRLHERDGGFLLQQFGTMSPEETILRYVIVPGSGLGALEGISGALDLVVEADGTHRYTLNYGISAQGR